MTTPHTVDTAEMTEESGPSKGWLYLANCALFLGCIGASIAGAGEIFTDIVELFGPGAIVPALVVSILLGVITTIASIFIFANSIKKVLELEPFEVPEDKKECAKMAFQLFFSPLNALVETSCAFGALKEAGAPIVVCYTFAVLALPLNYFFSQHESEESMGIEHKKAPGEKGSQVGFVLGAVAACGFSLAIAYVTFITVSLLIPVPGLNFVIAGILAAGCAASDFAAFYNTVKDITNGSCDEEEGCFAGCVHFFRERKTIISSVAAFCFGTGTAAEVYMSLQKTMKQIPLIGRSDLICTIVSAVGALAFAAVNAILAYVSFDKILSEDKKPVSDSADEQSADNSDGHSAIDDKERPAADTDAQPVNETDKMPSAAAVGQDVEESETLDLASNSTTGSVSTPDSDQMPSHVNALVLNLRKPLEKTGYFSAQDRKPRFVVPRGHAASPAFSG